MGEHSSTVADWWRWPTVVVGAVLVVAVVGALTSAPRTAAPQPPASAATTVSSSAGTSATTSTTEPPRSEVTVVTVVEASVYGVPTESLAPPPAPGASIEEGFDGRGLVTIAKGGASLSRVLQEVPFVVAREGLVFPAHGYSLDRQHIWVFTSCDSHAWVPADRVLAQAPTKQTVGPLSTLAHATIVLDPGHGGPFNVGAVGRGGLQEKLVNLLIAERVRDLLSAPRSVEWETGIISNGNEISAAGWVILTRVGGVEEADYEAGLKFRSAIANAVDASAMVSIHNNAGIETRLDEPGSDVYYQSQLLGSRRFSEIMVQELERSLSVFEADWVGDDNHGAASRISARDGLSQYYGVLRRTEIPTVLTEGAYISNPSEAALLETPAFQQAYADAIYRAVVRFLTTQDAPVVSTSDPVIWTGVAGSGDAHSECAIPPQP